MEVTGAARLYRAASGGPQGYASVDPYREARELSDQTFDIRVPIAIPTLVNVNVCIGELDQISKTSAM